MKYQIEELTTNLRSLMYMVEENPMDYSERGAVEAANSYMNRALQAFEEFSNNMRSVTGCLEGRRLNNAQEAAAGIYREAYQIMQELEEAKRKLSYIVNS